MDAAFELTPLVALKLIVYSLGALVHLFLMVLILGNRGLRRLEWLLFSLVAALFMWNSGNLLSLNVGLFYVVTPPVMSGISRAISFFGLALTPPILVHFHSEYAARLRGRARGYTFSFLLFYLPLLALPWFLGRLLNHLELPSIVALRPWDPFLAAWLALALVTSAGYNLVFSLGRWVQDPRLVKMHVWLAGLQLSLAAGLGWGYLVRPLPFQELGGYFPTFLMLLAVTPGSVVLYGTLRFNFLNLRVQRNLVFTLVAIFAGLIYLNLMRRLSVFLEVRQILPSAVTEALMIFLLVIFLEPIKKVINRALHSAFVVEFERLQKLSAEIQEFAKQAGDVAALAKFVESRVAVALGLGQVVLRLGALGAKHGDSFAPGSKTCSFLIRRGEKILGELVVVPAKSELSGEQFGGLQLLAEQLAAAIELCQLISAKVQLERALAEKARMAFLGEMVARIAHNVKNPLGAMKTLVQLLAEDASVSERVRQDCGLITAEIDRLNRNIAQVLRYVKPPRDVDRPADLVVVVGRVLSVLRAEAERRQVRLQFETPSDPCPVEGGEEAASDIVSNLVVNALEASPPEGRVRVRIVDGTSAPGRVELWVEDQGPGIAPELKNTIFQPFFTTRPGGTGLGLAIVARRAEEVGGSVECVTPRDSEPGGRFRVEFRAAPSARPT